MRPLDRPPADPPRPERAAPPLAVQSAVAALAVLAAAGMALSAGRGAGVATLAVAVVLASAAAAAVLHRRLAAATLVAATLAERLDAAARGDAEDRAVPLPVAAPTALARLREAALRLVQRLAAERQRMRDIAARAFRAQEAERLRIAGELQERTAQELAVALIRLRAARGAADPLQRERLLDELRDGLVETTDGIRRYARALHPPALRDIGVVSAIEAYARALAGASTPHVELEAAPVGGLLSPEAELALYRVVQEALGNAARHAAARTVRVRIGVRAGWVEAEVKDDGRGFDVAAVQRADACLGLFGMQARALALGGALELESGAGGTSVRVRLPVFSRRRAPGAPLPVVGAADAGWAPAPPASPGKEIPDVESVRFPAEPIAEAR